jgi:predicted transcriptional regulator
MEKSLFTEEYRILLGLLRDVRVRAGTSQVELSIKLGTTQSLISKCERGERRLDAIEPDLIASVS